MSELISYGARLKQGLKEIERLMVELLDNSTIEEFRNDPSSGIVIVTPPYYWGKTNERQKLLQNELIKRYADWIEHFRLLFNNASQEIYQQIEEADRFVLGWIEKNGGWEVPSNIQDAKSLFAKKVKLFYELLELLQTANKHEIIIVPDTNSLIFAPDMAQYTSVAGQPKFTIIIVPTVLAELDKLKIIHREQEFRDKVNSVIRSIKGLRTQGSLLAGVTVNKTITVRMVATEPHFDNMLKWLNAENADDRIVASVLEIQKDAPSSIVIMVTSDINLQNKAEMANLAFVETPSE